MNAFSKTALYAGRTGLPPLVERAVALANDFGFIHCCTPEQGTLLQVLVRGRAGGVIGETGTGCGASLAWMATAVGPKTRLVSIEIDATRAAACQKLFADLPNVTVLHGDWRLTSCGCSTVIAKALVPSFGVPWKDWTGARYLRWRRR